MILSIIKVVFNFKLIIIICNFVMPAIINLLISALNLMKHFFYGQTCILVKDSAFILFLLFERLLIANHIHFFNILCINLI